MGRNHAEKSLPPGLHGFAWQDVAQRIDSNPIQFVTQLARDFGDIVYFDTAYGPTYFVNHPDYINHVLTNPNYARAKNYPFKIVLGEGLLSSEGELWRRHRKMIQPKFQKRYLETLVGIMNDSIAKCAERWELLAQSGQPFDMSVEMFDLTVEALIHAMFSGSMRDKTAEIRLNIIALIDNIGTLINIQYGIPLQFSPAQIRRYKAALTALDEIIYSLITQYRSSSGMLESGDLVTLLLGVRDEETGEGLNDEELRDEILTILVAGSETTALTMAWCWYLLDKHHGVADRLQSELNQTLGGRKPTIDDLPNLTYTKMILQETLRLYPPLWAIYRQAAQADEIGGYHIMPNSSIILSAYTMQRHPVFWDDAECFDPERFAPEKLAAQPRYAYFPFGGGRHLCLGNHLFILEAQLFLATLSQRFRPRLIPGGEVEPMANVTLRQRSGVPMYLETRC